MPACGEKALLVQYIDMSKEQRMGWVEAHLLEAVGNQETRHSLACMLIAVANKRSIISYLLR